MVSQCAFCRKALKRSQEISFFLVVSWTHTKQRSIYGNSWNLEARNGKIEVNMQSPVSIFICYAHADEKFLKELAKYLAILRREGLINEWYDCDISTGTEWKKEINKYLDTAQIILLLVSPDFMDSDYSYSNEMKRSIERDKRGEAIVIPIILRPCFWNATL